jgi:phage gp36-like protein
MAYSDKTYFLGKIKSAELDALTADNNENPQDDYLDQAILAADNMIDGYLSAVITDLPLSPVPEMVKQFSYYIATYFLHDRIQYNDIPDRVKSNYDTAINYLKDVASGKATIPDLPVSDEEDSSNFIDYNVDESNFTRDSF